MQPSSALINYNSTSAKLLQRFQNIRQQTETLCEPLQTEDMVIQSMPDVSPTKWHLAHTTWFFESFVLPKANPNYQPFDSEFAFLFNSYYVSMGERHARPQRGLLSRPTVEEVFTYRHAVDDAVQNELNKGVNDDILTLIELGLNHEQQHQELLLMDIKHVFSCNPIKPAYLKSAAKPAPPSTDITWQPVVGGVYEIGRNANEGFCFDNETPKHRVFIDDYSLADRTITNAEWLAFIQDGGYDTPSLWLSDGWDWLQTLPQRAPLYWRAVDGQWHEFTLGGETPIREHLPVCHISFYEAEAYATWANARLPTEAEWEVAFAAQPLIGQYVESENYHPVGGANQFGDLWEWTRSNYSPYSNYNPLPGSLGEYNGKFMNNQYVLRGGSCATPEAHNRHTYRNFFAPHMRWQFSGLRLAKS